MTLPNRDGEVLYRHSKYWRTNWLMTYSPISQTWTPIYSNPKDCPPPVSSGSCVKYTLIFIQEGYIQEGQPQFGQKIKKFIYMMTSLLLNKGLRLNSVSNLLIYKKECTALQVEIVILIRFGHGLL